MVAYTSLSPTLAYTTTQRRIALAFALSFIALVVILSSAKPHHFAAACDGLPSQIGGLEACSRARAKAVSLQTVDLVFAYHSQPLDRFAAHLATVRNTSSIAQRKSRVFVWNNGDHSAEEIREALGGLQEHDEVLAAPNAGREGGVYLHVGHRSLSDICPVLTPLLSQHIMHLYNSSDFGDHTVFLQDHGHHFDVAMQRLDEMDSKTGFLSLGPYLGNTCTCPSRRAVLGLFVFCSVSVDFGFSCAGGRDGRQGGEWPFMREIFASFNAALCPMQGQLSSWTGQIAISRRRIVANSYLQYARLHEVMTAPQEHWIHRVCLDFLPPVALASR
jgi:hypothetical protein